MDQHDDFYLVLPSNSSMGFFPDNTTTCFTTHLCREMRLTGDWLVGLAEIHIPCTIMHLQKSESYFDFRLGSADKKLNESISGEHRIPFGVYENLEQLAWEINNIQGVRDHQQLIPIPFHKGYYSLLRKCNCKEPHYTTFNEKIRRIFGFESYVHRTTGTFATSNNGSTVNAGTRPACLARAIPDQLYIYTDICEPYAVGDTQSALLRIAALENFKYKFGTCIVKHFGPIHYIPVLQHNFQNIVVDIRDQHGEKISFEYGTLTVTLHFKRNH